MAAVPRWLTRRRPRRSGAAVVRFANARRGTIEKQLDNQISYEARFEDIVPGERIVSTYVMHQDDKRISVSLATVELQPEGSGTRLTFTENGAYLDDFDKPEIREQGTAEILDALGAYLSRELTGPEPALAPATAR